MASSVTDARKTREITKALVSRFKERLAEVRAYCADNTVDNHKLSKWNLRACKSDRGSGLGSHWRHSDATRELFSNWIDECRKTASDIGHPDAPVFAIVSPSADSDSDSDSSPNPNPDARTTVWHFTAHIGPVEVGHVLFYIDASGALHGVWRNELTCFVALHVYGNGFSDKAGLEDQIGTFGDGLPTSTSYLVANGATMLLTTAGQSFSFNYEKIFPTDANSWLIMEKVGKVAPKDKGTTFHVTWPIDTQFEDVFNPKHFLVVTGARHTIALTPLSQILFDEDTQRKLFVSGVFVCNLPGNVNFGWNCASLKAEMNRDRRSVPTDAILVALWKDIIACIEAGENVAELYDMLADVKSSQFYFTDRGISDNSAWADAIMTEFTRRYPGGHPYEAWNSDDAFLITRELQLKAVPLPSCLFAIVSRSDKFISVDAAITRKFETSPRVPWTEDTDVVRRRVVGMVDVIKDHARRDRGLISRLKLEICQTPSRYSMRMVVSHPAGAIRDPKNPFAGGEPTLLVQAALVDRLVSGDSERDGRMSSFLLSVYELLAKLEFCWLGAAVERKFCSQLAKFAQGDFLGSLDVDDADSADSGSALYEYSYDTTATATAAAVAAAAAAAQSASTPDRKRTSGFAFGSPEDADADDDGDGGYYNAGSPRPPPQKRARTTPTPGFVNTGPLRAASVPNGKVLAGIIAPERPVDFDRHEEDAAVHVYTGNLTPFTLDTVCDDQARFYTSEAPTAIESAVLAKTANIVGCLLRDVFGWDTTTTFGVYSEASDTHAFVRGSAQLFVNAWHTLAYKTDSELCCYYFAVLCHEMAHIRGCSGHDAIFADAMTQIVAKYERIFADHLADIWVE